MNVSELSAAVSGILIERCQTVAVAESSAGGLVAATLLAVPGASAYFKGGGVVYMGDSKQLLVSLSAEEIADARAATEPHALHRAHSASRTLNSDWGIFETGAAGPTGNRYGDAPSHSCIAVSGPCERAIATGEANREANMWAFAEASLALLERFLNEQC